MAPTLDAKFKNVTKFNVMRSSHLLNFSTWFRRLSICDIEGHIQFQFFVNQALRESLDGSARDAKSLAMWVELLILDAVGLVVKFPDSTERVSERGLFLFPNLEMSPTTSQFKFSEPGWPDWLS